MSKTIRICGVQSQYLDYLRNIDPLVSHDPTHRRKFIGVVLEVNGHHYCAPLSSPKPKHRRISNKALDVIKMDDGKLGVINLNNMIPVPDSAIIHIDISTYPDEQYKNLLMNQMRFIRSNEDLIKKKAKRLYQVVNSEKQTKLNERCCKFLLLEDAALSYHVQAISTTEVAATKE
ncbi:type III toxin-antitoxin system ToxN/AbiQ family toxin [Paenibacillus campinasensis]|uniref:Type III toxin-antitoxin system ToxN/AbiQ family toxin n=1 Tax=Paenibacillus campinasensis TaxID=66347 RepID=A0A268EIW5_9BACL|nr:type III toxin-antitoxin system ToxN/AbiQ family toxin [Paenibacillus campinasensis]PAD73076.1 hypothetical protein CHH67_21085 [Paenibacillus campinasensis]